MVGYPEVHPWWDTRRYTLVVYMPSLVHPGGICPPWYTWYIHHLYTPGTPHPVLHRRPAPSSQTDVPDDEALGSTLRIVRVRRRREPLRVLKV